MTRDRTRLPANRNCYKLSLVSWALAQISCFDSQMLLYKRFMIVFAVLHVNASKKWCKRFKRYCIAVYRKPITELRRATCRMGSHSVAWHSTQVNASRVTPGQIGRYLFYLPQSDGRLSWPRRLVYTQIVTHLSTNPARRRLTSLIGYNALSLRHVTNPRF